MRRSAWKWAVAAALAAGLAAGGCAKKQVREEGGLTPQAVAPKPAPKVETAPRAGVSEGALAPPSTRPETGPATAPPEAIAKVEPPPPQTAALERPGDKLAAGGGLAGQTAPGLQRIYFDFDQSTLGADAREILAKNGKYLQQKPGVRIRVEGHCDERGTTEYNMALGERRAKAAFQYLMDLGVDPNRMSVTSYGEESPVDNGHSEAAWSKNRRAEFVETQK